MISVICSWLDIACITLGMGFLLVRGMEKITRVDRAAYDMVSFSFCGLMVSTVYAQIWSLFGKVAGMAHIPLLIIGIIASVVCLRQERIRARRTEVFVLSVLIVVFAYGTSRGYIHYDTSLYHAQSIRWIEEYGVVKGLGNLQSRFAYNSAAFPLSALFSLKWAVGTSLHTVPGYMALLVAWECIRPVFDKNLRQDREANLIRLCGLLYILSIFTEMISPASDYFTVLAIFYILIKWMSLRRREISVYAMLCLLILWAVSMKLSAAPLLLLTLQPLAMMIKSREWKKTGIYILSGCVIFLPYIIRNYFLSGWLVYPFPEIDLFQVPWKVPETMVLYDYQEIATFARGTAVECYGQPLMTWLPEWFQTQTSFFKVFLLGAVLAVLIWCVLSIKAVLKKQYDEWLFMSSVLLISLLFWFFTSPSIRFGVAFLMSFPMLVFGKLYQQCTDKMRLLCVIGSILLLYKLCTCLQSSGYYAKNDYWIWQKPYEDYEVGTYQMDGVDIYYPLNGDQVGYAAFPSSERQRDDIGLLDKKNIENGFIYIPKYEKNQK